ncbi:MAG: ribonuclease HI [Candidatus Taylorbacteria bacterium]|nr:ribonuclease HI [Candidatus Taylorbacteria bacterium]
MIPDSITIFTDGSSRGNPGPGGFGAVVVYNNKLNVQELGGREEYTTNNRMELQAVISALSFLPNVKDQVPIVVYCDSSYVINGITKWIFGWRKNNWITSTKSPVENRDLWENLFGLTQGKKIEWKQVGGHVGVAGNERCDEIATAFADDEKPELYSGVLENYRIKNILDISYDTSVAQNKSSSRAHSKAKAYSYVSLVGGKIMTHKTWAECEARVKGKPARFKKATSDENEKQIISEFSS